MLDDRQRHTRKRLQEPLCGWLVGSLLLVLWVHIGEAGLILRKRPPQDKLHDRQHADTERQEVREALDLLVELDKQRRDIPTVSPLIIPLLYCYINGFQRASSVEKPLLGGEKRIGGRAAHHVEW
jgi:hypothetical protein